MFSDMDAISEVYGLIGAFPLARYNLDRERDEVDALLDGLEGCIRRFLDAHTARLFVIGDIQYLTSRWPAFGPVLDRCACNPHLTGSLVPEDGTAYVLYLCYEPLTYLRQVAKRLSGEAYPVGVPSWSAAFRTGCPGQLFRFSTLVPGTEQARLACTDALFQQTSAEDMIAPFIAQGIGQ